MSEAFMHCPQVLHKQICIVLCLGFAAGGAVWSGESEAKILRGVGRRAMVMSKQGAHIHAALVRCCTYRRNGKQGRLGAV